MSSISAARTRLSSQGLIITAWTSTVRVQRVYAPTDTNQSPVSSRRPGGIFAHDEVRGRPHTRRAPELHRRTRATTHRRGAHPVCLVRLLHNTCVLNDFDRQVKAESRVMFHPIGTVPMCSKELGGVVDPELRVYGTKNLRVGEWD